ncbi:mCG145111, partial [Mus musculus]
WSCSTRHGKVRDWKCRLLPAHSDLQVNAREGASERRAAHERRPLPRRAERLSVSSLRFTGGTLGLMDCCHIWNFFMLLNQRGGVHDRRTKETLRGYILIHEDVTEKWCWKGLGI